VQIGADCPRLASSDCGGSGSAQIAGLPARKMPAFSKADRFACRPQPVGMIERNTGHHRAIGVVGIDRIQAPAQPDFENQDFDLDCEKTSMAASVPNSK
jgi:hypothetical protein